MGGYIQGDSVSQYGFEFTNSIHELINICTYFIFTDCKMAAALLIETNQALEWIGFSDADNRDVIINESGINSLMGFVGVSEEDIRDLAHSFAKRTQGEGRINFGTKRKRLLVSLMHWVQDFDRNDEVATLDGVNNSDEMEDHLNRAMERANLQKIDADQVDTMSKAADPGKFKDERK